MTARPLRSVAQAGGLLGSGNGGVVRGTGRGGEVVEVFALGRRTASSAD